MQRLDFILLDLLCLQTAYYAAYALSHHLAIPLASPTYRRMILVLAFIQILVIFFYENFDDIMIRDRYEEFQSVFRQVVIMVFATWLYMLVMQEADSSANLTLGITALFYLFGTYAIRCLWKLFLRKLGKYDVRQKSLVVLTTPELAPEILHNVESDWHSGLRLAGFVLMESANARHTDLADTTEIWDQLDTTEASSKNLASAGMKKITEIEGVPVVSDIASMVDYVSREWVDEILIILPRIIVLPNDLYNRLIDMGVTVHLSLRNPAYKQTIGKIGNITVVSSSMNMVTFRDNVCKRMMDIAGGIVGCFLTACMLPFVGLAIYVQSPGPIFFSQERVGRNGRKFRLYKFRSMYPDAEKRKIDLMEQNEVKDGMMFKIEDDPRVIGGKKGIGGFIRRRSIDEFPQFWNVLKGEMSLVGTRPPTVDEWEKYDSHHKIRLAIKPGITGLWQVSGRSKITNFEEVVKLDRKYIMEWSLWLDVKILLKTLKVVIFEEGAK